VKPPVIELPAEQWRELQERAAEAMRHVMQEHIELAHTGRGFFLHDEFIETCLPPERR
jgi:hypothetical protein